MNKLRCLVGVKRCLDNALRARVDKAKATVDLTGCKMSLNPYCEIAVEEAVRQKAAGAFATTTSLTIGPPESTEVIRTALAMGIDEAIHIVTPKRTDLEIPPLIVARVFKYIMESRHYDVALLGKLAIDGSNEQTPQILSGLLGTSLVSNANKITIGNDGKITAWREIDEGVEQLSLLKTPAIISCETRLNVPRFVNIMGMKKAKSKKIEKLKLEELGVDIASNYEILSIKENEKKREGKSADLPRILNIIKEVSIQS